jgi:hypothetical protein
MLMTPEERPEAAPTDYAQTHCRVCDYGWVRIGRAGGVRTVCLLDREPVMDMVSCSRFELRKDELVIQRAPPASAGAMTGCEMSDPMEEMEAEEMQPAA